MMLIEDIRKQLQDIRLSRAAQATGLHVNTIRDVRDNPQANPTYRVVKSLSDYLESRQ